MLSIIKIMLICCSLFFSKLCAAEKKFIVLMGPSSAGRSSLAQCLQAKLGDGFAVASNNDFVKNSLIEQANAMGLLPAEYTELNVGVAMEHISDNIKLLGSEEQEKKTSWLSEFLATRHEKFCEHVAQCVKTQNIIMDAWVTSADEFACLKRVLGDACVLVFVHVPLDNIADRVRSRNATGGPVNLRCMNRALLSYAEHYTFATKPESLSERVTRTSIAAAVAASADFFHAASLC